MILLLIMLSFFLVVVIELLLLFIFQVLFLLHLRSLLLGGRPLVVRTLLHFVFLWAHMINLLDIIVIQAGRELYHLR